MLDDNSEGYGTRYPMLVLSLMVVILAGIILVYLIAQE